MNSAQLRERRGVRGGAVPGPAPGRWRPEGTGPAAAAGRASSHTSRSPGPPAPAPSRSPAAACAAHALMNPANPSLPTEQRNAKQSRCGREVRKHSGYHMQAAPGDAVPAVLEGWEAVVLIEAGVHRSALHKLPGTALQRTDCHQQQSVTPSVRRSGLCPRFHRRATKNPPTWLG